MIMHMIEICAGSKCIEIGRDLFEKALEIRKEMVARGDLTTRWWRRLMGALFTPISAPGYITFSFVDINGTSRSQRVKTDLGTGVNIFNTGTCSNRFYISVGSGTTSPTIDDYKLASKITDAIASHSLDDVNGVIILSAGFQFGSDTLIMEVGLEWEATVSSYNVCGRILIDRTVIPGGFTAPANTPITVTYRILM